MRPEDEIVRQSPSRWTAVLELPVTVAVNCWVLPGCRVTFAGETDTCTVCALLNGYLRRAFFVEFGG